MNVNNYIGALLGLAVGDALGATTENMWVQAITEEYGTLTEIIGGGWLHLKAGETTDDTGMTIAVAKGILKAGQRDPIKYIGQEFIKWRNTDPVDIGSITGLSLHYYDMTKNWNQASKLAHKALGRSAGNGSLMRCLPVALAYHKDPVFMDRISEVQSTLTHFDPLASEACRIYNRTAKRIIDGETLTDALRAEIKDTRYMHMTKRLPKDRPSGYIVDTFEWVIRVLLTSETYEEVVIRLANLGSDSDTTSAIAGGLAGLYYGAEAIPERLSSKILLKDELTDLAVKLYARGGELQ